MECLLHIAVWKPSDVNVAALTNSLFNKENFPKTRLWTFLSLLLLLLSVSVHKTLLKSSVSPNIVGLQNNVTRRAVPRVPSYSIRVVIITPSHWSALWNRLWGSWLFIATRRAATAHCHTQFSAAFSRRYVAALIAVLSDKKTNDLYVAGVNVFSCSVHQLQLQLRSLSSVRLEFAFESTGRICGPLWNRRR